MEDNNIKDINDLEIIDEEKPNKFRKVIIILIAIFLIILLITYLLTNSLIRNIFVGLVESSKVNDNIVNINSTNKLIFQNNTYNELLNIYDNNIEKEFKVCLKGNIENKDYYINSIYIPKTFLQTSNRVVSEYCGNDTIVDMHSHPLKHCLPSEQDFQSFSLFKQINNNAIMAVMCERGRFNFYI